MLVSGARLLKVLQSGCRHVHKSGQQCRSHWLLSKKSDELKRAAIACGAPCSGAKQALVSGLENALLGSEALQGRSLSIISIDMGIKNLAYCHLKTQLPVPKRSGEEILADVNVDAWRRLDVSTGEAQGLEPSAKSPSPVSKGTSRKLKQDTEMDEVATPAKESFDPTIYADRAYRMIERMLREHQPTHILIERQRFRSGGGPAVQEWSLRVGMFEFMLYATLHTLKAQGKHSAEVVPTQPAMVNRFWLAQNAGTQEAMESKPTSAAMKKYKIEQVARILDDDVQNIDRVLALSGQASEVRQQFLEKYTSSKRGSKSTVLPKLDDVSDCLLQGLAWIAWQESRARLDALKTTKATLQMTDVDSSTDPLSPWMGGGQIDH